MIGARDISLLGTRLHRAAGPHASRIPDTVLQRDYCLAWFLVGLGRCPLMERVVFKGGTALKRCYFGDYRFSEDLDFTFTTPTDFPTLRAELEPVFAEVRRRSQISFRFLREDQAHQNCFTFYIGFEGPMPIRDNEVKVDITLNERLVFPVENRNVVRGYTEYTDLPEDAPVRVYSLPEIAAEKIVALSDRARNEPRDLFDVWYLTSNGHVELPELRDAIQQKLALRRRTLDTVGPEFKAKEARLRKLWTTRLAPQMSFLPEFDGVFRAVQRSLRQAGFLD